MLDERWIRALHVETMREEELHAEREHHVLFQASTIGALLDGAYEGDLRFGELAEHGDLGLGTLNGGHVLGSRSSGLRARLDPSSELHVELPPAIDLADPDLAAATHAAVELVERNK